MDDLGSLELTPQMIDEIAEAELNGEPLPYCIRDVRMSECGGFILINFRREGEKGYSIRVGSDLELVQALRQLIHLGILPDDKDHRFDVRRGALIHEPVMPIIFRVHKGTSN